MAKSELKGNHVSRLIKSKMCVQVFLKNTALKRLDFLIMELELFSTCVQVLEINLCLLLEQKEVILDV